MMVSDLVSLIDELFVKKSLFSTVVVVGVVGFIAFISYKFIDTFESNVALAVIAFLATVITLAGLSAGDYGMFFFIPMIVAYYSIYYRLID